VPSKLLTIILFQIPLHNKICPCILHLFLIMETSDIMQKTSNEFYTKSLKCIVLYMKTIQPMILINHKFLTVSIT